MYTTAVSEALSALNTSHPFFAHVLYDQGKVVEDENCPGGCAATNGKTILVNPTWFAGLTVPERVFVLAHEIFHWILLHCQRSKLYSDLGVGPDMKPYQPMKMNIAQDYVINAALKEANVGQIPAVGLYSDKIKGTELTDDVYRALPDQEQDGEYDGQDGHGGFDAHIHADNPPSEADSADMERAVKAAVSAAKAMGKLPGSLSELVDQLMKSVIPWRDMLRAEMTMALARDENNWNKPNRRRLVGNMGPAVIMPSMTGHSSGTIVVQVDTSGSVSNQEISRFLSEIKAICDEAHPEMVYILWVDAEVAKVDIVEDPMEFDDIIDRCAKKGVPGRGGTDMRAGFEYVSEWGIEPSTFITFTDMYTPFPEPTQFPCIWGSTTEGQEAPFGTTIYVPPEDNG